MALSISLTRLPTASSSAAEPLEGLSSQLGQLGTILAQQHRKQIRHPLDTLRRNDAELSHVAPQRIHQHGALAHQKIACPGAASAQLAVPRS